MLKTLGDHIQAKRIEKRLLQQEMARMLGVTRRQVQLWERDRQVPSDDDWKALVNLLGLDGSLRAANPTAE